MRNLRPVASLFLALLVAGVMCSLCYWAALRVRVASGARPPDELAWLGREFQLSDAELARIRTLHEAYRPKCEAMCVRIAEKNRELAGVLKGAAPIGPEIEGKLAELASLRAECQAQMLRHFQEVARTMPVQQGVRYLDEMERLTLGLPGPMEEVMAHPTHEHP